MSEDPLRILDSDASSELGRALRVAHGDVLGNDAIARVRAGVLAKSAVAATAAAAANPATVAAVEAAAKPASGWLVKAGAVVLLAGAGAGLYWGLARTERPAPAPITTTVHVAPLPPVASEAPVVAAVPQEPPIAIPSSTPAAIATAPQRALPRPAPPPSADAVTREGAMLLEARRVLDTDPAKALALVKKCEMDFPNSQLYPERQRIAQQAKQRLAQ
jgi:hypothetical protein